MYVDVCNFPEVQDFFEANTNSRFLHVTNNTNLKYYDNAQRSYPELAIKSPRRFLMIILLFLYADFILVTFLFEQPFVFQQNSNIKVIQNNLSLNKYLMLAFPAFIIGTNSCSCNT